MAEDERRGARHRHHGVDHQRHPGGRDVDVHDANRLALPEIPGE